MVRSSSFAAMKKLLLLGACLAALGSTPVMAQIGGADVVVVRVSDGLGFRTGKLAIIRGEGKNEEIELPLGVSFKQLINSGEVYRGVFLKLYQEGYSLKSTFSTEDSHTETLVFVKEK